MSEATKNAKFTAIHSKGVEIYGVERMPTVGSLLRVDGWKYPYARLIACEQQEPIPGFPGADFRLPTSVGVDLACNIIVTGRTIQRYGDESWIRVKIVIVGDCEPNTEMGGWIRTQFNGECQ